MCNRVEQWLVLGVYIKCATRSQDVFSLYDLLIVKNRRLLCEASFFTGTLVKE